MKKNKLYIIMGVFVLFSVTIKAQLALPYYTGFDTPAEQADWQLYKLGVDATYGPWTVSAGGISAPNSLYHDYNNTGTVEDWYVSPALNFTTSSEITLKVKVFSMTDAAVSPDHFGIWYSSVDQDPTLGSYTEVLNLTSLASSTNQWIDTTITLPFTQGTGYIGFKYMNGSNWFTVNVDNINVTALPTGITDLEVEKSMIIYPNPIKTSGTIEINPKINILDMKLHIYDAFGRVIKKLVVNEHKIAFDKNDLTGGLYFYELINNYKIIKTGKIMIE